MANKLLLLPLFILSLVIFSFGSFADVLVDDADSNTLVFEPFTSAQVPTGSGQVGDYELIICGVPGGQAPNIFSDPNPGTWTELDSAICGNGACSHGVWGRFTNNPASEDITCSWDAAVEVFAAGSFRYNNVDTVDPIIDLECVAGTGNDAIAPSIQTLAGSQVVRIFTYVNLDFTPTSDTNVNNDTSGSFSSFTSGPFQNISIRSTTGLFPSDGPTGTANNFSGTEPQWRACTIALRMAQDINNVPTMSEWGLIIFAAFAGIAGLWYLRRRQVTA